MILFKCLRSLNESSQGLNLYICSNIFVELEVQRFVRIVQALTLRHAVFSGGKNWTVAKSPGISVNYASSLKHSNKESTKTMNDEVLAPTSQYSLEKSSQESSDDMITNNFPIEQTEENWDADCECEYFPYNVSDLKIDDTSSVNDTSSVTSSALKDDSSHVLKTFEDSSNDLKTNNRFTSPDESAFHYVAGDKRKVFVKQINFRTSRRMVWNFFEKFGPVKHCSLLQDSRGKSSGCANITFSDESGAQMALNAPPEELCLHNRNMQVLPSRRKIFHNMEKPEIPTNPSGVQSAQGTDVQSSECFSRPVQDCEIMKLNDDSLAYIFSYLSLRDRLRIEKVCTRWRSVSSHFWNIKHLSFKSSLCCRAITDRDFERLISRGSLSLLTLELSNSLTERSISVIGKYCTNLVSIKLSGMHITKSGMKILANGCSKLKSVAIHGPSHTIGEDGLWWLFRRCTELENIDLQGNLSLKGQCLHVIGSNVTFLCLNGCHKLADIGIEKIQKGCPKLKHLEIGDCLQLTDQAFVTLGKCTTIETLDISDSFPHVTEWGLCHVARLFNLKVLIAVNNSVMTDSVLTTISAGCLQLGSVDLHHTRFRSNAVTDVGLLQLAQNCRYLSSINIGYLCEVTDASLEAFSRIECLSRIIAQGCVLLSDEGVIAILESCRHLEKIDVSGCLEVTKKSLLSAIDVLAQKFPTSNLELAIGGTSIESLEEFNLPPNIQVSLLSCREFSVPGYVPDNYFDFDDTNLEDDDDDDEYSFVRQDENFEGADFLENDDFLASEHWNLS